MKKKETNKVQKTIVLTGGGTMGHVTPNLALVPELKKNNYDIYYIGSKNGIEKDKIEALNIPYYSISAGKLRRYIDFKNFTDIFRIMKGYTDALSLMRKIKPDIVFSKGGFVSCPVVWAAWTKRIPVVIHESDMTPGLANKISVPFAKKVCYSFPETKKYLPENRSVYTGIPIRQELFNGSAETGIKICGFNDNKPVIMIIGGSQGSASINKIVRSSLKELLAKFNICHICGEGNIDDKLIGLKGYKQFGYIDKELPHLFAACSLVVSRAGATTLFELLELKKPNILIPLSTGASRGDQILNAESFRKQGFSMVLREERIDKKDFIDAVNKVYNEKDTYIANMSTKSKSSAIYEIIRILNEYSKSLQP